MRVLGIDYGDSRIGIAMSDPFGWTAQGVETIYASIGFRKVLDRILQLVKENSVERILVGYPLNMNGTEGPRAKKTQDFIDTLSKNTKVEIIKWDERLSSVSANRTMHELGVKTSKKKGLVDTIAAVHILQGYLDKLANKGV